MQKVNSWAVLRVEAPPGIEWQFAQSFPGLVQSPGVLPGHERLGPGIRVLGTQISSGEACFWQSVRWKGTVSLRELALQEEPKQQSVKGLRIREVHHVTRLRDERAFIARQAWLHGVLHMAVFVGADFTRDEQHRD